ncbi:efflux transporter outer membrane subunit [Sinorhizobium meliloti]|uniref:efflux transporter outer membrane subunit n=1 Tax=Rhizobium meliloti TaxID=382 RepID=UPI0020908260|nr:efflux transporter outer membrane subunit [Sinorhizobium meliloti]MCO5965065.1 efflux transporter outer membrane subunit [Sinorhizobium meliloti]
MLLRHSPLAIVSLLLAGCVVGPDHKAPEIALPAQFSDGKATPTGDTATIRWWTAFQDKRLDGYIETGLEQNLDVLQAFERIRQADANVIIAGAGGLPRLDGSASHSTSGSKGSMASASDERTNNTSTGNLTAVWFLDLFGGYKRSRESALAELGASYNDVNTARLSLLSQVASAYIDARYYQERIALTHQNLASRRETLELTRTQRDAGEVLHLDVVQAEGLVNSTLAELPGLETDFKRSAHRLATLLGLPASSLMTELQRGAPQPVARFNARTGVPADLIRNRPDIRAAELRLASAVAEIGVAEAQLYPSISLGGTISPSFTTIAGGGEGGLTSWSFGPQLTLPIFDGGQLKAGLSAQESAAREAYLVWKQTVLTAIEEVENALTALVREKRTATALRETVSSYEEALELATASYRAGASSLLDVLDAQREVSTAQANLAGSIRQVALNYVALNVAVGNGHGGSESSAGHPPEEHKSKLVPVPVARQMTP